MRGGNSINVQRERSSTKCRGNDYVRLWPKNIFGELVPQRMAVTGIIRKVKRTVSLTVLCVAVIALASVTLWLETSDWKETGLKSKHIDLANTRQEFYPRKPRISPLKVVEGREFVESKLVSNKYWSDTTASNHRKYFVHSLPSSVRFNETQLIVDRIDSCLAY